MGDIIERSLFKDETVSLEKEQEVIKKYEWLTNYECSPENMEAEMEKARKEKAKDRADEWTFKSIIALLLLFSPFILLFELAESILFRCSSKRRMREFRKMVSENIRDTNHRPKAAGFSHNYGRYIIHYNTFMEIYPDCDISIWVPEEKVCDHPSVPWQKTMELFSIKVPYTFHSCQADGYVSDLEESDWLLDFKKKLGLTSAIAVINYDAEGFESFLRHRYTDAFMDTFPFEPEALTPLVCSVELLVDSEPGDGVCWVKTKYRCCPLGRFRLERKSYVQLTGNSRKRLERILDDYALPKLWL